MCWGANLRKLVVETMELVKAMRAEGFEGNISVAVFWNGNELVGERGIADDISWPFKTAQGDWNQLMDDARRQHQHDD